jgi:small subunit ribosomal protein S6
LWEVVSLEATSKKNLYEGMFLIDSARAAADWDGIISVITKILERAKAEIVSIRKWDDRKLAYDIKGKSRGLYIICYFRVDGGKIQDIEKNVQLSEQIIRVLILNAEHLTPEDIEKDTPAIKAEKEEQNTAVNTPEAEPEQREDEESEETEDVTETEPTVEENIDESTESEPSVLKDE